LTKKLIYEKGSALRLGKGLKCRKKEIIHIWVIKGDRDTKRGFCLKAWERLGVHHLVKGKVTKENMSNNFTYGGGKVRSRDRRTGI